MKLEWKKLGKVYSEKRLWDLMFFSTVHHIIELFH